MFQSNRLLNPKLGCALALGASLMFPSRDVNAADGEGAKINRTSNPGKSLQLTKDWQRWQSYPKNPSPISVTNTIYEDVMRPYLPGGSKEIKESGLALTGAEHYTGKLLTSIVNSTLSYGMYFDKVCTLVWQYQSRLPRRSEVERSDVIKNVAEQSFKFRRFPMLMSQIGRISGTQVPVDCKEASLMSASCALNEVAANLKSGESAKISIVGGLYFGPDEAINGVGHAWATVLWRGKEAIIDVQTARTKEEVVREASSTNYIGIATFTYSFIKDGTNTPTVTATQDALLAPPIESAVKR